MPRLFAIATVILLCGSMLLGCRGTGWGPSGQVETEESRQAHQLYDEAWTMIHQEYVDGSFNGQDWNRWRQHFNGRLQDLDDAYVAIGTMVASLNDEYTRFLRPREMKEQTINIDSRLYGVGIQISMRDNKLVVMTTIEDTPAERAGLMPKDLITHIDGHETAGMSVEEAADRIRGPRNTYVTLSIRRGEQNLVRKIQRDEIKLKSVFTKEVSDPRIGYIRMSSFISENMLNEMDAIVQQMRGKQALILDVRGNYGGLFTNAVEIADMFLDQGDIVSIVNRAKDKRLYQAHSGSVTRRPLVVLIDGGSASASEILAGALKDNKRAYLIGERTFGKGLVQKINTLSNGTGMNITISKYFTPNGVDINKKGIEPDDEVVMTEADFHAQRDPQLTRAIAYLQAKIGATPKPAAVAR